MPLKEKANILLVDDKPENFLVLEGYLDDLNLNFIKATSGKEALGLTLEYDFALILLDVQMPYMDGFETAQLIRGVERTKHIPIIFVTAISKERKFVFKGYEVGAVDYLFKPIDPEILRAKVRVFLDLHNKKKELEAEIAARKKAEESLKLFRCLIDQTNDGIFVVDSVTGDILDVNLIGCKGLGFSRKELLSQKVKDIVPSVRGGIYWQKLVEDTQRHGFQLIESEQERKDGSTFPVEVNATIITHRQKRYMVAVARDITERKEMEKALIKLNEELEERVKERTAELEKTYHQLLHVEKLSAVGRLSASIAHEVNNPLFGIRNVLGGIKKRAPLEKIDKELVLMALQECDRIKFLVQGLKDFNRPTEGIWESTDVHEPLNSILLLLKKEFKNKKIKIEKHFTADIPPIRAVADQIKQVLLNLLNNAADAMPDSGGTITITTGGSDDMVTVRIRDTGSGIKPEDLDRIFEPFFTTKPAVKGTGLGLPVSYGIIKRHGGRIEVDSAPGEGSAFTVFLPIDAHSSCS